MGNACSSATSTAAAKPKPMPETAPAKPVQEKNRASAPPPAQTQGNNGANEETQRNNGANEEPQDKPEKQEEETTQKEDIDGELVRQLLLEDDDELKAVVEDLENADRLKEWWDHLDSNGNGVVSLSEIKKLVQDKQWNVSDPALMQAYKYTTVRGDDFVQRGEFPRLLRGMVFMNRLWDLFDGMDTDDDRRIDSEEFKSALEQLKYPVTDEAAAKGFDAMDKNDGGKVLFGEFSRYMASLVSPKAVDFDGDDGTNEESS